MNIKVWNYSIQGYYEAGQFILTLPDTPFVNFDYKIEEDDKQ